jgi:hypothetical protein
MTDLLPGLRAFLIDVDQPIADPKRRAAARIGGCAGAVYLAYAAATYLDLKSGLPVLLCWPIGLLLAVPFVFALTRPLLAWRLAFVTGLLGGLPVQLHHRTPFSWHPALLAAQLVILVVLAFRHRFAVSVWAWLSMAGLVTINFYPADRLPLIEVVAVAMACALLVRRRRGAKGAVRDSRALTG